MFTTREIKGVAIGMIAVAFLHCLFVLIVTPIITRIFEPENPANYLRGISSLIYVMTSLGLSQLLYVVPLGLWLKSTRRKDMLKGVVVAAILTALLSSTCAVSFLR